MKVAICEYGAGNVRSVELAFRRLGAEMTDDVLAADLAVLPGVGSVYFAHSYAASTPCATAWSEGIVAEARLGSFVGVQFHPEKSGPAGARFLAEQVRCLSRV